MIIRTMIAACAVGAVTLGSTTPAVADSGPRTLTPDDAEVVLGTWGLDDWSRVDVLPKQLRWRNSCSTGVKGAWVRRLADKPGAGIRSAVEVERNKADARALKRRAAGRVAGCIHDLRDGNQLVDGMRVRTKYGTARVYGAVVGHRKHAVKSEYVAVARSGRAVEVMTFRAFAQDVLPQKTLRQLVRRTVKRLDAAA